MGNRDILAIGASAGGVEALTHLAAGFRPDLPASVLITLHLSNQVRSSLDELLTRAGPLKAVFAQDGEPLRKGRIYIAPPDRHLMIDGTHIVLGTGPRENNSRPAIDPMLRSIALCCCNRAIGVVLTGTLGDGASGLWSVNQCGGMSVVQDPSKAAFSQMPQTALELSTPDHVVGLDRMPSLLDSLVHQPQGEPCRPPEGIAFEVEIAKGTGGNAMEKMDSLGRRSVLSCPDCHGVMWEIAEGGLTRYRCHVGHTYASDLMNLALDENLRRALASAQRALEERVALAGKLYSQAKEGNHPNLMSTWSSRQREYEHEMNVIKEAIRRMEGIAAREEMRRPDRTGS
ncbi:MAG TPA: chemotaxis protein CheB [Steroidobacteraceae bacterium]|nr:chemotaxis protein CheB [Steroidobacteraceae bacterium]